MINKQIQKNRNDANVSGYPSILAKVEQYFHVSVNAFYDHVLKVAISVEIGVIMNMCLRRLMNFKY